MTSPSERRVRSSVSQHEVLQSTVSVRCTVERRADAGMGSNSLHGSGSFPDAVPLSPCP